MDGKCKKCGHEYSNITLYWRCRNCDTLQQCTQPASDNTQSAAIAQICAEIRQARTVVISGATRDYDPLLEDWERRLRAL